MLSVEIWQRRFFDTTETRRDDRLDEYRGPAESGRTSRRRREDEYFDGGTRLAAQLTPQLGFGLSIGWTLGQIKLVLSNTVVFLLELLRY